MDHKTNPPDSDETARRTHVENPMDEVAPEDLNDDFAGLQTSTKSGKHSSVEKLAAHRPESETGRGALPVDGAFGKDEEDPTGES